MRKLHAKLLVLSMVLPVPAVAGQNRDEDERRHRREKIMEARFTLQRIFDENLETKVPVGELDLPEPAVSRFDADGDGLVTFEEYTLVERGTYDDPELPRDRSAFTHLRKEGFPLNVNPEIVSAGEAPVRDDDMVMGVVVNGEPRAYPVNYMNGPLNEVVNDELGGEAIAPSW